MSNKALIRERLDSLGVPCEWYEHAAANTMADCLALPYAQPDVTFCKNILLCNRQKTEYYLYITLPDKPFRTADVSKLLGVSRLSFAPEESLEELCRLHRGSLSPLALWFDQEKKIHFVIDRSIRRDGRIAFHPCDNTATVIFRQEDFFRQVVPALAHEPIWLDVPWPVMGGGEAHG